MVGVAGFELATPCTPYNNFFVLQSPKHSEQGAAILLQKRLQTKPSSIDVWTHLTESAIIPYRIPYRNERTSARKADTVARRAVNIERLKAIDVGRHVENSNSTKPLHDGGGLYLRRFDSSKWFWYLRYTSPVTKRETWAAIDPGIPYPRTSLARAREAARAMRVQVADGEDISIEREKALDQKRADRVELAERARADVTLRQVFEQWRATDLQPRTRADGKRLGRKDGGKYVAEQFKRHVFPSIGDIALKSVRKPDLFAILDAQKARGQLRTANVLLTDLKQLLRFAADREIIEASPIDTVKKERVGGADTARNRVLDEAEIRALTSRIPSANLAKRTEHGLWLILATGVRVGELMGAAWHDHSSARSTLIEQADATDVKFGEVNLARRTWYIPETKNQRDHTIHLSDFAVKHFEALAELSEHDAWIFPDASGRKPVCVKSFGKQLSDRQRTADRRMTNRTAKTDSLMLTGGRWTAHDLRRTAATLMAQLGIATDVIHECLNHKQADRMSLVYIQNRREAEQAVAFDALGKRLDSLVSGSAETNVVPLRRRARRNQDGIMSA